MSAVLQSAFDIELFDAPLGAEILGLDLSRPLSPRQFQRIHKAHLDHHLLMFRDQRITPRQQVDFSRRFGPLQIRAPGHARGVKSDIWTQSQHWEAVY